MNYFLKVGYLALGLIFLVSCATPKGATKQEKKSFVLNMHDETLTNLNSARPETKSIIKNATGYAVFSNINANVYLLSAGNGYGVAVDNSTGEKTYMKMNLVGVGPGIGVKDIRTVFVFKNKVVFNDFIEKGWEFGGSADVTAKSGEKGRAIGGEAYFEDSIIINQMTEAGVALQATLSGTKYQKDYDLN
jgi:lipid-binding SYLF domain-containing protein